MEIELILTNKCNLQCKQCYTIHGDTMMSPEVLDKAIDYIKSVVKQDTEEVHSVNLVGGEVGLYSHAKLNEIIDRITENGSIKNVEICCRSNLMFGLTDDFIKFAKRCNQFGTSYDYKARFGNQVQEDLWKKNVQILQKEGVDLDCIITINKMLMTLSPTEIFEFVEDMNFNRFDLHRLFYPNTMNDEEKKVYDTLIRPKNKDVDKWMLSVYLEYEKRKAGNPELSLDSFEAIKSTIQGEPEYTHYRNCQRDNRTILPNGMMAQCTYTVFKPYYNLMTGETNQEIFDEFIKHENTLHENCVKCPFVQFCRGDCCWFPHDDTGCPGLKSVYQYILMQMDM